MKLILVEWFIDEQIRRKRRNIAMTKSNAKEAPVFRNRTKIDQVVYDESYTAINVPSGKTVKGDWFKRYATGKRNSTFVLVDGEDKEEDSTKAEKGEKDDENKGATDSKSKE